MQNFKKEANDKQKNILSLYHCFVVLGRKYEYLFGDRMIKKYDKI